jgi:hypothetical protein
MLGIMKEKLSDCLVSWPRLKPDKYTLYYVVDVTQLLHASCI